MTQIIKTKSRSKSPLVFSLVTIVFLIIGYFLFNSGPGASTQKKDDAKSALKVGKRYRIFVKSITVPTRTKDGETWDELIYDDGTPDVYFKVNFRGANIYTSSTINNTIVAEFAPAKINVSTILTGGGNISDYFEAANVVYDSPDENFTVLVYDEDMLAHDEVGYQTISLASLKLGQNTIKTEDITYTIQVIDSDADINKTLKDLGLL